MEPMLERQPLREIVKIVKQRPDAQRTPSDDIVQRLMSRIRELEHRLFDPEGAWGGRLRWQSCPSNHFAIVADVACQKNGAQDPVVLSQSTKYIARWACDSTTQPWILSRRKQLSPQELESDLMDS